MSERILVSSGSPMEPVIGFSRAVRIGSHIWVAGTAPIGPSGETQPGGLYGQTLRCLEIIEKAIKDTGGELRHVVRTRVMLTDITDWKEAARAHGEVFGEIRPVSTFVEISGLIDPTWLVEIEAEAVMEG